MAHRSSLALMLLLMVLIMGGAVAAAQQGSAPGWQTRIDRAVDTWQRQVIDPYGTSPYTSLALDAAGQPHVVYVGHDGQYRYSLKYAVYNGSAWQITSVDNEMATGWYPSLALDAADRPHICYYDDTVGQVKHATFDGATWRIATVASDLTIYNGQGCSIAVDGNNHPHIVYSVLGLFYARFDGARWHLTEVDHDMLAGRDPALALDRHNRPRIAYDVLDYPDYELRYAAFDGFDWQIEAAHSTTQAGARPSGISLALAADGSPHISYFMDANGPPLYTWKTLPLERWTFLPAVQRR